MRQVIVVTRRRSEERLLLEKLLRKEQCQVLFHDSAGALQAKEHDKERCTLILDLDDQPIGDLFVKRLLTILPGLGIVFLSSRSYHPELKETFNRNVCACIKKPVNPEELLFCLKNLCEFRR